MLLIGEQDVSKISFYYRTSTPSNPASAATCNLSGIECPATPKPYINLIQKLLFLKVSRFMHTSAIVGIAGCKFVIIMVDEINVY